MSDSLIPLILFVGAVASLPWLLRQFQTRMGAKGALTAGRVVSALAVGPQQRIVTVQISSNGQDLTMVLGVTPSSVTCLHKWDAGAGVGAPTRAPEAREVA